MAKELLHLRDWFAKVEVVVASGREAYRQDDLRQEAGDSLLMKIGETANRLRRAGLAEPPGVRWSDAVTTRNWLIHQYDAIDRDVTWSTLTLDVPQWRAALAALVREAEEGLSSSS